MRELSIDSIRVSPMNYQRVVILKEKESDRYLPIWIGPAEADAIAVKLQDLSVPRPLTHDLLGEVINALGGSVNHILVNDLHNDTFFAKIVIPGQRRHPGNRLPPQRCYGSCRARPSSHLRRRGGDGQGRHPPRRGRQAHNPGTLPPGGSYRGKRGGTAADVGFLPTSSTIWIWRTLAAASRGNKAASPPG